MRALHSLVRRSQPGSRRRFLAQRYGGSYLPLILVLLVTYMFIAISPPGHRLWDTVTVGLLCALIPLAVGGTDFERNAVFVSVVGAVVAGVALIIGGWADISLLASGGRLLFALLFLTAELLILTDVVRQRSVTVDTILGGVGAYLIFALIWAFIFTVVLRHQTDALLGPVGEPGENFASMLYFSVVVQTTLGFGDIVPNTGTVRGLVQIEALLGQLYIAVFVAWIVGRLISSPGTEESSTELPDTDPSTQTTLTGRDRSNES